MSSIDRLSVVLLAGIAVFMYTEVAATPTSCQLDKVRIYPVSQKASFVSAKTRIENDDDCWYRVEFSGRAHNPPDALNLECPGCSASPPGRKCDCTFSDTLDVPPHSTVTSAGCRDRVCTGCPSGVNCANVCDNGVCTLLTSKVCQHDSVCLNDDTHHEGTCHYPCLEVYLTEATILCASFNGNSWGLVPGPMSVSTIYAEELPRRPCAEFMPAQGSVAGSDACTELEPKPGCMVDNTNGPVVVTPQFGHGIFCSAE